MSIKIEQKIVDYGVVRDEPQAPAAPKEERPRADVIQMNERLERPERLEGTTYKVKTPNSEHAMYITINDIVLNEDTPHEHRRPFEIFINSKNMDHFQWIVALTRIMSAVFRKGGDVTFLVEELRSVFDPHGGYFKKGGRFVPSVIAEIGDIIECHLKKIGMIVECDLETGQKELIRKAREKAGLDSAPGAEDTGYPDSATVCRKCSTKAVVMLDGCMTCLSCGDSKCG
ncbi:MAG: NrdJb [Chromatiales bacterium]|nr:NrdJb [Chromatiales bacterium]